MPSPEKRSSVPSCSRTRRPIAAWYSRSTAITSSGSAVSVKAVKPRRSRKTTVISRRWLFSGSSAPPATMASASCGEKKRLSRPTRSSCATPSATRCSSVRFHCASSARWRCTSSCSALMRSSERTRAISSAWLTGLLRKSSAPASMPLTRSCSGSSAVTSTTGSTAVRRVGADRAAHVVAVEPGIITSSSTRSGGSAAMRASASSPDGGRAGAVAFGRQHVGQQADVLVDVVDDQDVRGRGSCVTWRGPRSAARCTGARNGLSRDRLGEEASKPERTIALCSSGMTEADTASTGIASSDGCPRECARRPSMPSMSGSWMSISTRSGRCCSASLTPSSPVSASSVT